MNFIIRLLLNKKIKMIKKEIVYSYQELLSDSNDEDSYECIDRDKVKIRCYIRFLMLLEHNFTVYPLMGTDHEKYSNYLKSYCKELDINIRNIR